MSLWLQGLRRGAPAQFGPLLHISRLLRGTKIVDVVSLDPSRLVTDAEDHDVLALLAFEPKAHGVFSAQHWPTLVVDG
ncbi:MAG: hypothetical protein ACI841_002860 [Planctomycetota bacterium]|jgi:hypothetical protein